jgi:hypothetical protein
MVPDCDAAVPKRGWDDWWRCRGQWPWWRWQQPPTDPRRPVPVPAEARYDASTRDAAQFTDQAAAARRARRTTPGTTAAPPPFRRALGALMVWTGDSPWFGEVSLFRITSSGGRYDPLTPGCPCRPSARRLRGAIIRPCGRTGSCSSGAAGRQPVVLDSGRYDPIADVWTPLCRRSMALRTGLPCGRLTGERMLVWGGFAARYPQASGRWRPADPDTDT